MIQKCLLFLVLACVSSGVAWARHSLTTQERKVLGNWLRAHKQYRIAVDDDCGCDGDISQMKRGYGGDWTPVSDYHPYVAAGDFNGDGFEDFAVALIDQLKKEKNFTLIIFNGPFKSDKVSPSFRKSGMELSSWGLSFGPPRPKPYRLLLGPFESDAGVLLIPHGASYRMEHPEED